MPAAAATVLDGKCLLVIIVGSMRDLAPGSGALSQEKFHIPMF